MAAANVLIIDDEPAVVALVSAVLKKAGARNVSTCSTLAGARECWRAQTGNFDVVLTDFCLPDGSSAVLLQELLRAKANIQVIIMTGFSAADLGLEDQLNRNVAFLQKPFLPSDLIQSVNQALSLAEPATPPLVPQ